jgi:mRNA interferase MazF
MPHVSRGDIWLADLNPVVGREQAGTRPVLVLSNDVFNNGPSDLVVVAPTTKHDKKQLLHIRVGPPEGGLKLVSYIKTEDVRSISKARLKQRLGQVEPATLDLVKDRIRILLDL